MSKFFLTLSAVFILVFVAIPVVVSANWTNNARGNLDNAVSGLGFESNIETTTGSVLSAGLALVGTIFLILTVYAGILWMTASGNEDQVGKSKKILGASVIGLFIVMSSYAVTQFVTSKLGAGSGGGGGAGGGGDGTRISSDQECRLRGGECVTHQNGQNYINSLVAHRGVTPGTYDPSDPCDPDGTGEADPFNGAIGTCGGQSICCELTDWAGDGTVKCSNMEGRCLNSCPPNKTKIGECDTEEDLTDMDCCQQ